MTLNRVPMLTVQSPDDVVSFLTTNGVDQVIIFDIDNTLAPQGCPIDEFATMVNAAIDRFEEHPNVGRVIALTNGPQRQVTRMISRGNKPWTSRRRLGLKGCGSPVVVVGDQVLTDGLLAWRLRATFLHLVIDDETEERRQVIMRRCGGFIIGILFRRESCS